MLFTVFNARYGQRLLSRRCVDALPKNNLRLQYLQRRWLSHKKSNKENRLQGALLIHRNQLTSLFKLAESKTSKFLFTCTGIGAAGLFCWHRFTVKIQEMKKIKDEMFNDLNNANYESAYEKLEYLLSLIPSNSFFYEVRSALLNIKGALLKKLDRLDEALLSFDEAIQLNPAATEAFFNKANVLMLLQQHEEAILLIQECIALKIPPISLMYNTMGVAQMKLGRYADAKLSFDNALEADERNYLALANLASIYLLEGKYEEALSRYEDVLKISSQDFTAHMLKGLSLSLLNRHDDAMEAVNLAVEYARTEADKLPVYNVKAQILVAHGNFEEAKRVMEKTLTTMFPSYMTDHRIGSFFEREEVIRYKQKQWINAHSQYELGVAAQKGQWKIFELLLENEVPLNHRQLTHAVDQCCNRYQEGTDNEINNIAALDMLASDLTHMDITALRESSVSLVKYMGHLQDWEGEVIEDKKRVGVFQKHEFAGWEVQKFLGLRIRVYLEILVKIKTNDISSELFPYQTTRVKYTKDKLVQKLETELLVEIETLRTARNLAFIKKTGEYPKDKTTEDRLVSCLARNVAKHIMKIHSASCYNAGYKGHSLYVNFFVDEQRRKIFVRVDNLGDGHNRHISQTQSKRGSVSRKVIPYTIEAFSFDEVEPILENYLMDIFHAKYQLPSKDWFGNQQTNSLLDKIYMSASKPPTTIASPTTNPERLVQVVGNCTLKNHNVGVEIRLGRNLFAWLIQQEYKILGLMQAPIPELRINFVSKTKYGCIIHSVPHLANQSSLPEKHKPSSDSTILSDSDSSNNSKSSPRLS